MVMKGKATQLAFACSKLTIEILERGVKLTRKISERRHRPRSGIFVDNFKHISLLVVVFLLLTLNI